jgi:hypothetical protein
VTGRRVPPGLPWRPYEPTPATIAHRHAVGLVRAEAEASGQPRVGREAPVSSIDPLVTQAVLDQEPTWRTRG